MSGAGPDAGTAGAAAGAAPLRRTFPKSFLWGAATSAHQVEGGNTANDWWRFEQEPGRICGRRQSGDGVPPLGALRRGLRARRGRRAQRPPPVARVEPHRARARPRSTPAAVAHYHAVLASLKRTARAGRHAPPLHQSAVDRRRGRLGEPRDRRPLRRRSCASARASSAARWTGGARSTSPRCTRFRGWSEGVWPPAVRDDARALAVIANLLEAHGRAYRVLHEEDRADADGDGRRGAWSASPSTGRSSSRLRAWIPLDRAARPLREPRLQRRVVEARDRPASSSSRFPGASRRQARRARAEGRLDWYRPQLLHALAGERARGARRTSRRPASPLNDLGWEIYPEGLERALARGRAPACRCSSPRTASPTRSDRLRPRALVEYAAATAPRDRARRARARLPALVAARQLRVVRRLPAAASASTRWTSRTRHFRARGARAPRCWRASRAPTRSRRSRTRLRGADGLA